MRNLDLRAVLPGALLVVLVGVPIALIGSLVLEDDSNAVFLFALPIVLAYVAGGYVAGSKQPDTPLMHGAFAAFAGFAVAQLASIVVQLAAGDDVNPLRVLLGAFLAANIGLLGGWLAGRRAAREPT